MSFSKYQSKPITRLAHCVEDLMEITEHEAESTSTLTLENGVEVNFKHYEPVESGDYIVYLTGDDVYHCSKAVFEERNIV